MGAAMTAADSPAGDFGPPVSEAFSCLGGLLGQVLGAVREMSGGRRGPGWRGGPWEWGPGRPRGAKDWPGGFSGHGGGWWPGPPGFARGPKAGRGDVRAAILALLQEGPRNGYQIMSEIEERSSGAWRPSPGAVYPALQQLADEGLVEAEESGGRRAFSLTDAGRRHIEENPEVARAAWESMGGDEPGEVPGLFIQAARLGGSIVQMAHAGTPEQIQATEQLLEQTRSRIYQILAGDVGAEQDEL
jgi:DNA-binding PadR family transcriptional regulator